MHKTITWVLVADGHRARILKNEGPNRGLHNVLEYDFVMPNAPSNELGTDRPGHVQESANPSSHTMENTSDLSQENKKDFAKELASRLRDAVLGKEFDKLILIAPAKTLGDLRNSLDKNVANTVSAEINKDLTHTPISEIEESLSDVLVV